MSHFEDRDEDFVEEHLDFFLKVSQKAFSLRDASRSRPILTFICALRLWSMVKNISMLNSKT